jgi:hypothetical protein
MVDKNSLEERIAAMTRSQKHVAEPLLREVEPTLYEIEGVPVDVVQGTDSYIVLLDSGAFAYDNFRSDRHKPASSSGGLSDLAGADISLLYDIALLRFAKERKMAVVLTGRRITDEEMVSQCGEHGLYLDDDYHIEFKE